MKSQKVYPPPGMRARAVARIAMFSAVCVLFAAAPARALNYFELEVYPYYTADKGEFEIENSTTHTSRGTKDEQPPNNNEGLTRSSLEFTYGVTDSTEITYYRDYARPRGASFEYVASRYRARTRFYEKGELPVDLGLYVEIEAPRDGDAELELRGIIEKDFGRWTVDFNPILELEKEPERELEFLYAASLIYRANEYWRPHLDLFGDFEAHVHLVSPAADFKLGRGFSAMLGVAFGMTEEAEQRLVRAGLEWEFY